MVSARSVRRPTVLAVVLGAAALALAGCGTLGYTSAKADKTHGKALFQQRCGACHTLADAGTTGTIGPDLDVAFKVDLAQGMTEDTVRQVVRGQIAYAITTTSTGSPGMPKNLVKGQDAADVAAYVASVASKPPSGVATAPAPAPATTTTSTTPATTPSTGGASAATIALGKSVFASNGCGGCHTLKAAGSGGNIGPDLDHLPTDAQKAGKALAAYIRESIVMPNAYIVPGFPAKTMPGNFGQVLKPNQLNALIAFLLSAVGK